MSLPEQVGDSAADIFVSTQLNRDAFIVCFCFKDEFGCDIPHDARAINFILVIERINRHEGGVNIGGGFGCSAEKFWGAAEYFRL